MTVLLSALKANPKRGAKFFQSVCMLLDGLPPPVHASSPVRFGRPAAAPSGLRRAGIEVSKAIVFLFVADADVPAQA